MLPCLVNFFFRKIILFSTAIGIPCSLAHLLYYRTFMDLPAKLADFSRRVGDFGTNFEPHPDVTEYSAKGKNV
jgi:hypothetical protein